MQPSLFLQLRSWLLIGATSFGGGAATILLMRREWVDRRGWVTAEFFDRAFAMSQIVPGINILAIAIQLGRAAGGRRGVLVALLGLLTPAVAITAALTELFNTLEALPPFRAALAGVSPATGGLTAALAWQVVAGAFRGPRPARRRLRDLAVFFGAVLALAVLRLPPPLILVAAALLGALLPEPPVDKAPLQER